VTVAYADVPPGFAGDFYKAVAALIPSTVKVYTGSVPTSPTFPYAVLWGSLGDEVSESLADIPDELRINFRVTYVGETLASVGWVASRVRPALNRARPYVPGWVSGKLRQSSLMDVQSDYSVTLVSGRNPVYAVDEFALVADKL
jgi:hypothetical protein